ncbi:MAG: LexA family transcriptional regulator [Chitinophagales bacterium]
MASSTINANIKFIRKQKSMTQQSFADLIGIKRSSLGAYEEGRAKPNYETIQTIARKFNISIDKLLTQDLAKIADESVFGSSSYTDSSVSPHSVTEMPSTDIEGKKLRVLSITVDENDNENIELVAEKARAGYLDGYADPEYIENLAKFRLPFLPQGTYRAFEIKGDSMLPLQPGSVVVGEYVADWYDVKNNDTYIIVSQSEGIVYKRVLNNIDENKTLILQSDNPAYPPYPIKIEEVVEMWNAKAFISKELPSNNSDTTLEKLMSTVIDLQQEMIKLKNKMK